VETIQAGIQAGLNCFGENYAEQAMEKILSLKDQKMLEWHMIGHVQSRKAEIVCEYFDMVHSVDRMKIARHLSRFAHKMGKMMPVLCEVNLSGEESKYGWRADDEKVWPHLAESFNEISQLPQLEIRGLMTMPPFFDDAERTRPIYIKLRRLQDFLRTQLPGVAWDELSGGTSFDYEVAIEEGATIVRIGTDIFGARPTA